MLSGRHGLWMEVVTLDRMCFISEKNKAIQKKLKKNKMHCLKVKVLLKAAVNFLTFAMASGGNESEILKPSSTQSYSRFFRLISAICFETKGVWSEQLNFKWTSLTAIPLT